MKIQSYEQDYIDLLRSIDRKLTKQNYFEELILYNLKELRDAINVKED